MDLQQIRNYVRGHLDVEQEDLPNSVLDVFIREGSKRVEQAEKRWPFYEASWTLLTDAGVAAYDLPAVADDISEVAAIHGDRHTLEWLGADDAASTYPRNSTVTGVPRAWSQWGSTITLYPTPVDAVTLTIRGYRTPIDWVEAGAGASPDLPDVLHNTVAQWALARGYAQQDDIEMATVFERQFADELQMFRRRLHDSPPKQPLVLNSRRQGGSGLSRLLYDFEG